MGGGGVGRGASGGGVGREASSRPTSRPPHAAAATNKLLFYYVRGKDGTTTVGQNVGAGASEKWPRMRFTKGRDAFRKLSKSRLKCFPHLPGAVDVL